MFPKQTQLLSEHLKELKRILKPGVVRLNWNSLGISDFIQKCSSQIGKFESLVNQIQKNSSDVETRLTIIETTNLFKVPPPGFQGQLPFVKVTTALTSNDTLLSITPIELHFISCKSLARILQESCMIRHFLPRSSKIPARIMHCLPRSWK